MLGAIIGDVVGSRFEFDNINTKNFELWGDGCEFTDDTVMTIAVAESLLYTRNPDELGNVLKDIMRDYGHGYPNVGYGGMFRQWLMSADPQPYNSFGNGSAMRVSPCGYVADTLDEALALAKASAEIYHNHPEGIKGAEAVAATIFLARGGATKDEIKAYIENNFYELNFSLREVRQKYHISESCQDTVPHAIKCFLDAENFEDTIRNAVSIGGDSDTIACVAGSIAEAYFKIPTEMVNVVKKYLPKCFVELIDKFYTNVSDVTFKKTHWSNYCPLCGIDTYRIQDKERIQIGSQYYCFDCFKKGKNKKTITPTDFSKTQLVTGSINDDCLLQQKYERQTSGHGVPSITIAHLYGYNDALEQEDDFRLDIKYDEENDKLYFRTAIIDDPHPLWGIENYHFVTIEQAVCLLNKNGIHIIDDMNEENIKRMFRRK